MLTEAHNKHYSERLFYADNVWLFNTASPCHNGNISVSQIMYADSSKYFAYLYDQQNRLTYSRELFGYRFRECERYTYDNSGNIVSLQRYDSDRMIDDLSYSYGDDCHQLLSITDNGQDADLYSTIEYHNAATQADTTFRYDANGNLVCDLDRGISVIKYNILNLPDTIQFVNGNQIVNLYDAAGRKYKSIAYTVPATAGTSHYEIEHYTFATDTVEYLATEYSGNIELCYTRTDTVTQRIHNAIGYYSDSTYYHYIKDHLGNVCAVVNSTADTTVQRTMYYASGVPMAVSTGRDKQPYMYNGKEFIEAHGWNTYDYGFRGYYATIGRFTSIDPLAEQTPWQSPYSYANNNFVNCIDYMGLSGNDSFVHDDGDVYWNGDLYGFGGCSSEWNPWPWSMSSGIMRGLGVQTLNYIIIDENGVVLDADLTSPDNGIYQINRSAYEGYVKNVINGNRLLFAQTLGTQIGVHRDDLKAVFRGMTFNQSWYNFSATLGIVNSFYIPIPDFTPEPITGKIHSAEMPYDTYIEMVLGSQGQFQNIDYMQYYNSFERGMITNPAIQGVAVGGLGVMAIEGSSILYYCLQNSVALQYGVGFVEGVVKAFIPGSDFTPYLYGTPGYQAGSDFGNVLVNIIKDQL